MYPACRLRLAFVHRGFPDTTPLVASVPMPLAEFPSTPPVAHISWAPPTMYTRRCLLSCASFPVSIHHAPFGCLMDLPVRPWHLSCCSGSQRDVTYKPQDGCAVDPSSNHGRMKDQRNALTKVLDYRYASMPNLEPVARSRGFPSNHRPKYHRTV